MILKRIQFTSTTWDKPRNVNSLGGNQTAVYVGQVVRHLKRGEVAEIGSLELDRQARMVLVRFVYSDGPSKGKPFRRLTVNDAVQPGEEADVLGLAFDDRTEFYFDEEPKATNAQLPDCSKCGQPSGGKPLCPKCYEASKSKAK